MLTLFGISALAQSGCSVLQANNASFMAPGKKISYLSGVMELPFLLISVFFAFATAHALKGGKFGKGMNLIAWGFVVMAAGHLHMQVEHFYGYNIFKSLLGRQVVRLSGFWH